MTDDFTRVRDLLANVAVTGAYTTEQGTLGRLAEDLYLEAALGAIADAGLDPADVDGVAGLRSDTASAADARAGFWAEYLGHPVRYFSTVDVASAGHCAAIMHAACAIGAGLVDRVVVVGGSSRMTDGRAASVQRLASAHGEFDVAWGSLVPSWFALIAQRHMHEYGTTSEDLARIAVSTRRWASMNPAAIMREPITVDDVVGSRMISSPLHLLDCCLVNDGAGALVLSRRDLVDTDHRPLVAIAGGAEEYARRAYKDVQHDLLSSGAGHTGPRAMAMAGVRPEDIDVAELYDCFTITVLRELEDLGFCAKGEAAGFVADGALEPGGTLPTNTHGGGLSFSHSFSGLSHAIEAARQLWGECGERQVPNAETALVHSQGGPLQLHSTVVMARA